MKPKLKPPRTKRLNLKHDGLLSNFGFKFNLRCYNQARVELCTKTAGVHADILVGRCRLTLSNPS